MPHRVATFLENPVSHFKKAATNQPRLRHSPVATPRTSSSRERNPSTSTSSLEEDPADDAEVSWPARMPVPESSRQRRGDDGAPDKRHNRLSFPGLHLGRPRSKERHVPTNTSVSVDWTIESPPIVFIGNAQESSGALVSGQLFLDVKTETYDVDSFNATLNIHVSQKRPYTVHCNECAHQYTEIKKWVFLEKPLALTKGRHQFPFSVLLGGHLPASMDGPLVSIAYEFKAAMVPKSPNHQKVKFEKTLDVRRSVIQPELPHHSMRVFPPTNIKANVHFPQVIYPLGSNTMTMRLDGLAKMNEKPASMEYWRLKKLTWKLEETIKTVAPSCDKHMPAEAKEEGTESAPKKGVPRIETRVIGEKTMFSGWKSDYTSADVANVECEIEYGLSKNAQLTFKNNGVRSCCDMKSADGTQVSHQLMVEMVVSQEWAPVGKPGLVTQTGVGRVLRMHFGTILTERPGIGISWDNEAPPRYDDVPPSPPAYPSDADTATAIAEQEQEQWRHCHTMEELLQGTRPGDASGTQTPHGTQTPLGMQTPQGAETPTYQESPRLRPQH